DDRCLPGQPGPLAPAGPLARADAHVFAGQSAERLSRAYRARVRALVRFKPACHRLCIGSASKPAKTRRTANAPAAPRSNFGQTWRIDERSEDGGGNDPALTGVVLDVNLCRLCASCRFCNAARAYQCPIISNSSSIA